MLERFLLDQGGATILEYIVAGCLALAVLGTSVWALMDAFGDHAGSANPTAVDNTVSSPT